MRTCPLTLEFRASLVGCLKWCTRLARPWRAPAVNSVGRYHTVLALLGFRLGTVLRASAVLFGALFVLGCLSWPTGLIYECPLRGPARPLARLAAGSRTPEAGRGS